MTKNKGWHNERYRHSLASRGISSTPESFRNDPQTTARIQHIDEMWKEKKSPRNDIREINTHDITIFIGGDSKEDIDRIERILERSLDHFTENEIKDMKNLYIESSGIISQEPGYADYALIDTYKNKNIKGSAILVDENATDDERLEVVLVHELVHALRWGRNKRSPSDQKEEKMTELETIARSDIRDFDSSDIGYYGTTDNPKMIIKDKEQISGDISNESKGKKLTQKVNKHYNNSYIKKQKLDLRK